MESKVIFDRKDITRLLSELYSKYSGIYDDSMNIISGTLENLRPLLLENDPYYVWDFFSLDGSTYDNPICIKVLTELRQRFNELMIEKKIKMVEDEGASDKLLGLKSLREIYAEAVVYLREDFLSILSKHRFSFIKERPEWIASAGQLHKYLLQARWVDAYPYFEAVANDENLTAEIRSNAETTCGEIVLYYFPYWQAAEKHFLNALALSENSIRAKRGIGQFYKRTGNLSGARDLFIENIIAEPHDYKSFNFIGDCFFDEDVQKSKNRSKTDVSVSEESLKVNALIQLIKQNDHSAGNEDQSNEEFWYTAGWKAQFLQTTSCIRLIRYYARDAQSLSNNEAKIVDLVEEINRISWFPQEPAGKFRDPEFKTSFRDISVYKTQVMLGHHYLKAGLYDRAREYYNEAIEKEPDLFSAYFGRAYMNLRLKEYGMAENDFRKILNLDERSYDGYWGLAHLCELRRDRDGAISMYQKCMDIRPTWSDWIENFIGNVHYDFGELDTAISYYRKAIAKNPHFSIYSNNLWGAINLSAERLMGDGNFQGGIEIYLNLAMERNLASDWRRLGKIYTDKKDYASGERYYLQAIEIDGSDAGLLEDLAALYEETTRYDEFKKTLEKAIAVNKKDGQSLNKMGLFLQSQGDIKGSLISFGRALQQEPHNHRYLIYIASCYEQSEGKVHPPDGFLEKVMENATIELSDLEYEDLLQTLKAIRILYDYNPELSFSHIASCFSKFFLKESQNEKKRQIVRDIENMLNWFVLQLTGQTTRVKKLDKENEWYLTALIVQLTAEYWPVLVNPRLVEIFFKQGVWTEETDLLLNYNHLPSDRLEDVVASIKRFDQSSFHVVYLSTLKSIVKLAVGDLKEFDIQTLDSSTCYIEFDFEGNEDKIIIENFNTVKLNEFYRGLQDMKFTCAIVLQEMKHIRKWWAIFEQILSNQVVK